MDGSGLAVGLLVEDGFDDRELTDISAGLIAAAIEVVTVGPVAGRLTVQSRPWLRTWRSRPTA